MATAVVGYILVPLLALIPILWFVGPLLWSGIGFCLGCVLRWKTDGRRARILEVMDDDERKYRAEKQGQKDSSSEDEEWESVDAHTTGISKNGDKGEKDWEGIVGFLHPFWYAPSSARLSFAKQLDLHF